MNSIIAVIGDTHHHIELALEGLRRLEGDLGRSLGMVASVGDMGLFFDEEDWSYLTGPAKYRHPEASPSIRHAWKDWPWPTIAIAGNHEPFNRLRHFEPSYFDGKLHYLNAGEFHHSLPGLRVCGLSGIYHPNHLEFLSEEIKKIGHHPKPVSWADLLEWVRQGAGPVAGPVAPSCPTTNNMSSIFWLV
ncbi:MAG: metallophosphoesterase [Verrucomicrobiota bacterium]|nr:metallophosphoesterase [Verrucomicrobiota bacterium]